VDQRLAEVSTREQQRIAHTMSLERQYESDPVLQAVQARASRLATRDRDLWEED